MAAKSTLSPDEVGRLLLGAKTPAKAPRRPAEPSVPWVRRYDRCANCRSTQPCLVSFSGETDWEPTIPLDDPIRSAIRTLRQSTQSRTISLCTRCIESLRITREPIPATGQLSLLDQA